jgi:hypothetical protein
MQPDELRSGPMLSLGCSRAHWMPPRQGTAELGCSDWITSIACTLPALPPACTPAFTAFFRCRSARGHSH